MVVSRGRGEESDRERGEEGKTDRGCIIGGEVLPAHGVPTAHESAAFGIDVEGDKLAAARLLQVGKSTPYRKLKKFGIS